MGNELRPVISITPNPALDLGGVVDRILPNEKNYVHEETRHPGGNALNAARILNRLGVPVIVSGFLGQGVGIEIKNLVELEGISHRFIPIDGPARISVTVSTRDSPHQTRLSFSGPRVSQAEYEKLLRYVEEIPSDSLVILGGSLPPGIVSAHVRSLIDTIRGRGSACLLDVPGGVLKDICSSSAEPLFIKPNLLEFRELIGSEVSSIEEVIRAARPLTEKIPMICVSSVENGAVLITSTTAWFGKIPQVQIQSTVGAGDSMVGAIAARLSHWQVSPRLSGALLRLLEDKGDELLGWGLAAACATLTKAGTELGEGEDIREYLPRIEIQRIYGPERTQEKAV